MVSRHVAFTNAIYLLLFTQTALAQINMPIARSADGRAVSIEDLILVDVRRVSDGTLQPTIAVRGA